MFGFITLSERGGADRLLADFAAWAEGSGIPVVAMVRAEVPTARDCEMFLRLLPGGAVRPISQDLGAGSEACALDLGALERAVGETAAALARAAPGTALILNKFGKVEAAGRGCRPLIGQALERGHPVLISVPAETRSAFDAFAEGLAEEIAPDMHALARFLGIAPPAAPPDAHKRDAKAL